MELIYFIGCLISCFVISIVIAKHLIDDGDGAVEATTIGFATGLIACWFWPLLVFPGLPIYMVVKGLEK